MFCALNQVLLDEFVNAVSEERQSAVRAKDNDAKVFWSHPLDPLMMSFSTFQSSEDLARRIQAIFTILDITGTGSIGFAEWVSYSPLLDFRPPLDLSADDWHDLISSEYPAADCAHVTYPQFETIMRGQILAYSLRQSSRKLLTINKDPIHSALPTDANFWLLTALREILTQTRILSSQAANAAHIKLPKGLAFSGGSAFFSVAPPPVAGEGLSPRVRRPAPDESRHTSAAVEDSTSNAAMLDNVGFDAIADRTVEILSSRQPLMDLKQQRVALQQVMQLDRKVTQCEEKLDLITGLLQRQIRNRSPAQHSLVLCG